MNLLEAVRHITFLLSEANLKFVKGENSKEHEHLEREIEGFSKDIEKGLATPKPSVVSNDAKHLRDDDDSSQPQSACAVTADAASSMFHENKIEPRDVEPIDKNARDIAIDRTKRCLEWAHDPARPAVPGAENLTNAQVWQQLRWCYKRCTG